LKKGGKGESPKRNRVRSRKKVRKLRDAYTVKRGISTTEHSKGDRETTYWQVQSEEGKKEGKSDLRTMTAPNTGKRPK